MPKTKKRTNVKKLKTAKELTSDQAKRVQGGSGSGYHGGIQVALADGSVRNITDGTSNTILVGEVKKK